MSVPFLKKERGGCRLRFPKALYPSEALSRLQEAHGKGAIAVADKGRYFELRLDGWSEEDFLKVCEQFFYFSKNVRRS